MFMDQYHAEKIDSWRKEVITMFEFLIKFDKEEGLLVKAKGPWQIVLAYPVLVSIVEILLNPFL